jgi:uncharacterized protein
MPRPTVSNRLSSALSPYLRQHAENPVDWYEWGEEAFTRAREEDKPVFLSIGYATCHWCHVMAHESFEDQAVAELLNRDFVAIKVDREERPDVDNLYMTVCQATTGHGGWPLTIFMTPDQLPFYAGTYFPRDAHARRPGMLQLLPAVSRAWNEDREKLVASAENLTSAVSEGLSRANQAGGRVNEGTLKMAYNALATRYDDEYGGFGGAPKFPTPHNLLFLLREYRRRGDERALEMVTYTLRRMRSGGIWDHVGFGFHRYSTDRVWKLPHFEKMLYDQALLAMAYTEAWQATRAPLFRQTAEEILAYVARDLTDPDGGFYSAEDADSENPSGEAEEGAFYVWTWEELENILSGHSAPLAIALFNVERAGNFRDEATGRRTGANVLHLSTPLADAAVRLGVSREDLLERQERVRHQLLDARAARPRPLLDDKILTDWNGLMIAALAKAAWVFDEPAYAERASRAATFVLDRLRTEDGRLLHRYRAGESGIIGLADDYAFLSWGLVELHQATFDPRWLVTAAELMDVLLANFRDGKSGGLFMSPTDGEQLIVRQIAYYDGATPSANSVAAFVLARLAHLTGRMELAERATGILSSTNEISALPSGHTMSMVALQHLVGPTREIVIAGEPEAADTVALLAAIREGYDPHAVVHLRPGNAPDLVEAAPYLESQAPVDGRATAFVCEDFACDFPVFEPESLRDRLAGGASGDGKST